MVGDCFLTFYIAICTSRVARKKKKPLFTVTKKNAFSETLLFKLIVFKSQFSSQPRVEISLKICSQDCFTNNFSKEWFIWIVMTIDMYAFLFEIRLWKWLKITKFEYFKKIWSWKISVHYIFISIKGKWCYQTFIIVNLDLETIKGKELNSWRIPRAVICFCRWLDVIRIFQEFLSYKIQITTEFF